MPPPNAPALPAATPQAEAMTPAVVVLALSLLLGIQPVTTDLYLPALPALTDALGARMPQAQLTLSALLLAFGTAQLVLGPLSDRLGRRPVLLWGLAAYTAASIGGALAASIELLIAWRIVQGAAMGAAVMVGRATVRDLYEPAEGARVMSRGLTGLGVIACLCAPVGGLLSDVLGWRFALLAPALFGAATLALVALRLRETLPHRRETSRAASLLATWGEVLGHRTFIAFTSLTTASYGMLFTFLATSPFVFIQVLGLSRFEYGLVMLWNSLAYIAGTMVCRRWLPRYGIAGSVRRASLLTVSGGSAMGLLALAGMQSVAAIVVPLTLVMLGHGVHQPCGQTGAVGPFPRAAGVASALNGFVMMLAAFAIGGLVGVFMRASVLPLALGIWFWSLCIGAIAWTLVRRFGDVHAG